LKGRLTPGNRLENHWVSEVLKQILAESQAGPKAPPETFARVIRTLMDPGDAVNEGPGRTDALALLNTALSCGRRPAIPSACSEF
jgi:hypothetical protein